MMNSQNVCSAEGHDAPAESRKDFRETIQTEIFVIQSGNKLCRAILSDISISGFKMTSQRSLDPSQPVYIRLPGLQSLGATVKWEGFKDYGCQFIHALNPNVFENLVSKLKTLKNTNE